MATTRHQEIERKYDVRPSTVFPSLVDEGSGFTVGQPLEHHLEAVYVDTSGLDLTRRGVTLRRRTGGGHGGWDPKGPRGRGRRLGGPPPPRPGNGQPAHRRPCP